MLTVIKSKKKRTKLLHFIVVMPHDIIERADSDRNIYTKIQIK